MDASQIVQLISTVGFPIVCCGSLFWYVLKRDSDEKERQEKSYEESKALRETLENNTLAITKLSEKLDK